MIIYNNTNFLTNQDQVAALLGGEFIEYELTFPDGGFNELEIGIQTTLSVGFSGNENVENEYDYISDSSMLVQRPFGQWKSLCLMGFKDATDFIGDNNTQFLGIVNSTESLLAANNLHGYSTNGSTGEKIISFSNGVDDFDRLNRSSILYLDDTGQTEWSSSFNDFVISSNYPVGEETGGILYNSVYNAIKITKSGDSITFKNNTLDYNTYDIRTQLSSFPESYELYNIAITEDLNPIEETFTITDFNDFTRFFIYVPFLGFRARIHSIFFNTKF